MGRLFWKFFFSYWAALLVAVLGVSTAAWLYDLAERNPDLSLEAGPRASFIVGSAASTLRHGGLPALRELMDGWGRARDGAAVRRGQLRAATCSAARCRPTPSRAPGSSPRPSEEPSMVRRVRAAQRRHVPALPSHRDHAAAASGSCSASGRRRRSCRSPPAPSPAWPSGRCSRGTSHGRSAISAPRSRRCRSGGSRRGSLRSSAGAATRSPTSGATSTAWRSSSRRSPPPSARCSTTCRTSCARRWPACRRPSAWPARIRRSSRARSTGSSARPSGSTSWSASC